MTANWRFFSQTTHGYVFYTGVEILPYPGLSLVRHQEEGFCCFVFIQNMEEIIDQIVYNFENLNLKKELSIMIEELILKLSEENCELI